MRKKGKLYYFTGVWQARSRFQGNCTFMTHSYSATNFSLVTFDPIFRETKYGTPWSVKYMYPNLLWWVSSTYTFWYSLSSTSSIHHFRMTSSDGFQQHFSIISKYVCCGFYMKKNVTLPSSLLLYWNEIIVHQFNSHLSLQFRYRFSCL